MDSDTFTVNLERRREHLRASSALRATAVPASEQDVRRWYLDRSAEQPGPLLVSSTPALVPRALISHLMLHKADSAIAQKSRALTSTEPAVTNMEGALHSFVTALVPSAMHGDYAWRGHHAVPRFPALLHDDRRAYQQARHVVLSTAIHLDFEDEQVAIELFQLRDKPQTGASLPHNWRPLLTGTRAQPTSRELEEYEVSLRLHAIYHLVGSLPAISSVRPWSLGKTVAELSRDIHKSLDEVYLQVPASHAPSCPVLSLAMISATYEHMLWNDLGGCELLLGGRADAGRPSGYVYTWDPPSIFARTVPAQVLNRLMLHALARVLSRRGSFLTRLRAFAFNDYADKEALELLRRVFARSASTSSVLVLSREQLFTGGTYQPPPQMPLDAVLVIHNNSDTFGQNIETEAAQGSLDGAIGASSSAAASLRRDRADLLECIATL